MQFKTSNDIRLLLIFNPIAVTLSAQNAGSSTFALIRGGKAWCRCLLSQTTPRYQSTLQNCREHILVFVVSLKNRTDGDDIDAAESVWSSVSPLIYFLKIQPNKPQAMMFVNFLANSINL